jgi:hypothetical protein
MEVIIQLHEPRYPYHRRLGEHQREYGRSGVEKNLLPLPAIEPRLPARSPSLYQLSYPGPFIELIVLTEGILFMLMEKLAFFSR